MNLFKMMRSPVIAGSVAGLLYLALTVLWGDRITPIHLVASLVVGIVVAMVVRHTRRPSS